MKELSIIIVTYHSEHDIYDCLQSVWQHCDIPREELEVIVVDNSPECEPMFTKLRQQYHETITLVHNTHNGGYGQGNNVGIRKAAAPVILIMNPDVRIIQPMFKKVITEFQQDKDLCLYGMKQMLSRTVKSPLSFDCSRRMNGYLIPLIITLCNKFDLYFPKWMFFQGSCFFLNKEKFFEVGLFDEELFMYGEEDDIHWRLSQKFGNHFIYNSKLCYLHLTLDRPMLLKTELKMVESIAISNYKKGIPSNSTYRNFIRYYRIRLFSTIIKKLLGKRCIQEQKIILLAVINELKKKIK